MHRIWKFLFFSIIAAYGLYYAPFGINETDGGFLTGLAWQLLNGKILYADVVYVRPPLPVWLRALEWHLLPEQYAVLGERWIFYAKVACYSWLGAAVLTQGARRWMLAVFGFVVSAHCYPAAAWHTVDGILFGALSIWCWTNGRFRGSAALAGVGMAACLLCKQSFYPMGAIWGVAVLSQYVKGRGGRAAVVGMMAFVLSLLVFTLYLFSQHLFSNFIQQTAGAASGSQALQHGLLDYFRIQPALAAASVLLLAPVAWWFWKKRNARLAFAGLIVWLLVLAGSYAWAIGQRQEFTAPFAQTRLLFWVALAYGVWSLWKKNGHSEQSLRFFMLLGLCWCASVSWGYNLPVLFAVPGVFPILEISGTLLQAAQSRQKTVSTGMAIPIWPILALLLLLALFRWGYEFVYRDGRRGAMTEHLGRVFPALTGVYSSAETAALYRDLRDLAERYGPDFKTLPAFPQANFLTGTRPPLPLDWVVEREMGKGRNLAHDAITTVKPVLFMEKTWLNRIETDPELRLTRDAVRQGRVVEETAYFKVLVLQPFVPPR